MKAEFAGALLEQYTRGFHGQRRHRVRLAAWRIERARARESGDADVPFHLRIVRLQFRIRDRPIGERRARDVADQAALVEVHLVEAPVVRREVVTAATDHRGVPGRRKSVTRFATSCDVLRKVWGLVSSLLVSPALNQ